MRKKMKDDKRYKRGDTNWRKETPKQRREILAIIKKGRAAGLKWNEISSSVYDKIDTYISPSALQQRFMYAKKVNILANVIDHQINVPVKKKVCRTFDEFKKAKKANKDYLSPPRFGPTFPPALVLPRPTVIPTRKLAEAEMKLGDFSIIISKYVDGKVAQGIADFKVSVLKEVLKTIQDLRCKIESM